MAPTLRSLAEASRWIDAASAGLGRRKVTEKTPEHIRRFAEEWAPKSNETEAERDRRLAMVRKALETFTTEFAKAKTSYAAMEAYAREKFACERAQ